MKFLSLILIGCAAITLTGCGYHLGMDAAKPAELREIRSIAIPTFQNDTYEPRISVLMADTLIGQMQEDGTYRIVSDEVADAILYCNLIGFRRTQARPVPNNILASREFLIRLEVEYELVERRTGKPLAAGRVNSSTSYFIDRDLQTDERQAIVTAIQIGAVKLKGTLTEGF